KILGTPQTPLAQRAGRGRHPGFSLSRGAMRMGPGGRFVVGGVGLEAAMQDADETVAQLAKRALVAIAAGAHRLVAGAGAVAEQRVDAGAADDVTDLS